MIILIVLLNPTPKLLAKIVLLHPLHRMMTIALLMLKFPIPKLLAKIVLLNPLHRMMTVAVIRAVMKKIMQQSRRNFCTMLRRRD